mmetsp:Transcript_19882/g.59474  ORF Transcript_19882/g.59474 Transcript_19882/m.59474 type:complete len:1131 (-) Transcript_19882:1421-4813(-)
MLVRHALQTIVVRILGQPPVIERPRQPIHSILLVLDRFHHDLGVHVIGHPLVQVALHGQRLVDELFVILLLGVLRQQNAHTRLVNARPARPTHHLQHVVDRVIHIPILAAVELLGVHDDGQMRKHCHAPRQLLRGHEHLDGPGFEQALDHRALGGGEPLVEEAHAVFEGLLQRPLASGGQVRLHGLLGHVEEALGLVVRRGVEQQVDRGHARLLPVRHEDDDGFLGRVMLDGLVDRTTHGEQPGRAVVDVEALDDHLQRNSPHVGREIEQARAAGADPLADVLGIRERGRQRDDADGLLHLHRDVSHAADDSFEGRADVAVEEVQLIDDEEADLLHGLARLPPAAHEVPLLRRRDHDVRLLQRLHIDRRLPDELGHLETERLAELVLPLLQALLGGGRVRRDVHAALDGVVAKEHAQHRELSADDLSAGRRCANEAIVVRGVQRAERLRLNRVEHLEALRGEELLGVRVAQRRERQRLEVEQLGVRRVLLREDQVAERDRQQRLRVDPTVRHHADEVLRRQGLCDGHRVIQGVLLLRAALLQDEHLLVQNLLPVHVLDEDPEWLGAAVDAGIPLEIGGDRQLHHEARTRDRLHVSAQIELRELMHQLVDGLAHFREADQLANLSTGEVVIPLPREVLLLDFSQDVLGQALEVPQGRLRAPHALVDHLAPVQRAQSERRPTTAQTDLEDRAHDAARRLLHVNHVRQEGEAIKLQFGNVRLEEHVHLGRRLVGAALHGHRHALDQLRHLDLLFLADGDVLELVGQGEQSQQLDVRHHGLQVVVECRDRRVPDVIMAGDAAKRCDLHLARPLVILDQVVLIEQHQRAVHEVHASLLQKPVFLGLVGRDAVKPGRAHHAHVQVRVTQPIHRVLSGLDCAQDQLSIDQIRQCAQQLGLHRQLLVVERQIILQLAVLRQNDAMARLVVLRPPRTTHHLHHVHRRQLVPRTLLGVVDLGALDDDRVRGEIDAPGQRRGRHEHLNVAVGVQILNELPVRTRETGMVDRETIREEVLQLLRLDTVDLSLQNLATGGVGMQELRQGVVLHRQIAERGRSFRSFLSGMHENQDLIFAGVFHELLVADLVHGVEALDRLFVGDTDVRLLQWHRPVLVPEVEQALLWVHSQKDGHVLVIRERG